jgi:type IV pilus assembly protein PilW
MNRSHVQTGLTLVELMMGMLIGIIVVGGGISVFSLSVKGQSDNIKLTRLNQDLRSMMDIMVRDIRRAGFVTSDPTTNLSSLLDNPFTDDTTVGATTDLAVHNSNTCIVYAYNRNDDTPTTISSNERLGFKRVNTELRMRQTGSTNENCDNSRWQNITEAEVEITNLQFTLTTSPLNVSSMIEDDDTDGVVEASDTDGIPYGDDDNNGVCDIAEVCNTCNRGSPAVAGDPACLYIRKIAITLEGRLASDDTVTQTITTQTRIRNDKFLAAVP